MTVWFVLPGDVDDRAAPSGGNVYDRRVSQALSAAGAGMREIRVPGAWPQPDLAARHGLAAALAACPDGSVVLFDGLVACGVPELLRPEAARLNLVVLVHLPLADETGLDPALAAALDVAERDSLHLARAVVATSAWAAWRLVQRHGLDPDRVHTVPPGVDPAPIAPGTDGRSQLLCVASLTPRKGHDLLVQALAEVGDLPWQCACVGPLRDPGQLRLVRDLIERHGLGERIRLLGPRTGMPLERQYAAADLLVLPSRAETYGMVVTEALSRGIPVLATSGSGVPEALGDGGLLVPPGDVTALAAALRRWLTDEDLRRDLRVSARRRRGVLSTWDEAARELAQVLATVRA
ncbi:MULTISPECIES: glycosyltransferase family 4 protein [unclassified Crossiella]|uniref:glycosyltransferase family 4 protein n=1 Tax=unclassified Crossiella TaxID=2620835 RepID=UPI001FFF694C|nr:MULTISPECIES: glycosyltransferase family 4 protein [unclassified Crossiella]MCK2243475.1 glycosyltransferase family 4 protein [Crossiella sp. S99.2]MCK2257333.1 glycosyltransferase family 4 protein [Crossiella sp. S99.1]